MEAKAYVVHLRRPFELRCFQSGEVAEVASLYPHDLPVAMMVPWRCYCGSLFALKCVAFEYFDWESEGVFLATSSSEEYILSSAESRRHFPIPRGFGGCC